MTGDQQQLDDDDDDDDFFCILPARDLEWDTTLHIAKFSRFILMMTEKMLLAPVPVSICRDVQHIINEVYEAL